MSQDKLSQEAHEAYAQAQKESDQAQARDRKRAEKAAKDAKDTKKDKKTASPGRGETANPREKDSDSTDSQTHEEAESQPDVSSQQSASAAPDASSEQKTADAAQDAADDAESHTADKDAVDGESEAQLQQLQLEQLTEELARARADLYNLEQEYQGYVRRSKADIPAQQEVGIAQVVTALMSVLDDIDLARQHDDLKDSFLAVSEKLEHTLKSKFRVKRYGVAGEAFDPNLHQAIQMSEGVQATGDTANQVIDQVAQPGYLLGEKVLRPAMVIVGAAKKSE